MFSYFLLEIGTKIQIFCESEQVIAFWWNINLQKSVQPPIWSDLLQKLQKLIPGQCSDPFVITLTWTRLALPCNLFNPLTNMLCLGILWHSEQIVNVNCIVAGLRGSVLCQSGRMMDYFLVRGPAFRTVDWQPKRWRGKRVQLSAAIPSSINRVPLP